MASVLLCRSLPPPAVVLNFDHQHRPNTASPEVDSTPGFQIGVLDRVAHGLARSHH